MNYIKPLLLPFTLVIALLIRIYGINEPLWLDEIYGYRLAQYGFTTIIENSFVDPHPPLYYLIQWVVSGFGAWQSEFVWRFVSLVSGILTIYLLYITLKEYVDETVTFLVCLMASTLPSLIFYSQEARSYALLMLLAMVSSRLTLEMLAESPTKKNWILWCVVSVCGLYSGYSYVMIAGIQLGFLGLYYYQMGYWRWTVLFAGLAFLGLIPFISQGLFQVGTQSVSSNPLTIWLAWQTLLAGEPYRYGFLLSHRIFPWLLSAFIIFAGLKTIQVKDKKLIYLIVQGVLPLLAYFMLSQLSGWGLPLAHGKQFAVLLPILLMLLAFGLDALTHFLERQRELVGQVVLITVSVLMLGLNAISLQAYWTYPKSLEGVAVVALRDKLQANEPVVSLHYSATFTLGFYLEDTTPIYLNPEESEAGYRYWETTSDQIFFLTPDHEPRPEIDVIQASGSFWVVSHGTIYRESLEALTAGCQMQTQDSFHTIHDTFEVIKVDCPT